MLDWRKRVDKLFKTVGTKYGVGDWPYELGLLLPNTTHSLGSGNTVSGITLTFQASRFKEGDRCQLTSSSALYKDYWNKPVVIKQRFTDTRREAYQACIMGGPEDIQVYGYELTSWKLGAIIQDLENVGCVAGLCPKYGSCAPLPGMEPSCVDWGEFPPETLLSDMV